MNTCEMYLVCCIFLPANWMLCTPKLVEIFKYHLQWFFTKPSHGGFSNFFHWVPMQEIGIVCWVWKCLKSATKKRSFGARDSGNDFGRFSVSFFEGRISYIRAACNYPTRNANLKSRISDIWLQSVLFLVSQILCRS